MGTKSKYVRDDTEACFSVLLELMTILGEYRDNVAVVGGWIPYFLLKHVRHEHTGSLDIDIVLDFDNITEEHYRSILELLKKHAYFLKGDDIPYAFIKEVDTPSGGKFKVEVDLLAGIIGGLHFQLANRLYLAEEPAGNRGAVYAVDLLGAAVGASLISVFFIPLLGMITTCAELTFLNIVALAGIIFAMKR